jgi:hypothetical protein
MGLYVSKCFILYKMAMAYTIQLFILSLDLFVFIRIFTTVESDVLFFGSKIQHSKCDYYVRIYRLGKWGNSWKMNRMGFERGR